MAFIDGRFQTAELEACKLRALTRVTSTKTFLHNPWCQGGFFRADLNHIGGSRLSSRHAKSLASADFYIGMSFEQMPLNIEVSLLLLLESCI